MKWKKCPTCGHQLEQVRIGIHFTPMQALVFDVVSESSDGIDTDALMDRMLNVNDNFRRNTMYVYVSNINSLLEGTGYRIDKYHTTSRNKGSGALGTWVYYLAKPRDVGSGRLRQLASS